jgi:succinate-acetate transporter protein
MSLATFVVLLLVGKVPAGDVESDLGWFLLAFAIFNTYMMFWSTRTNMATFLVFLTLEITEILLFIGFFSKSTFLVQLGGYVGVITALVAWYTSAAVVANSMRPEAILPVGGALWSEATTPSRRGVE